MVAAGHDGARIDLGDAVVVAGGGASFTVVRPGDAVEIVLAAGRIDLQVASRKGRSPLTVHADDVDVVVVGTRFSVARAAEVEVTVTEGVVRVERGGHVDTLAAGDRWAQPARIAVADPAAAPGGGARRRHRRRARGAARRRPRRRRRRDRRRRRHRGPARAGRDRPARRARRDRQRPRRPRRPRREPGRRA
ncbi:MAG: FecR domain-containing protein [Kofleriaceae bacterium]|nr:FecR domain-containing protein [Kofleriaceae bacterium]